MSPVRSSLARSLALASFSIRANLRSAISLGGMLALVAIAALGPLVSWKGGRGWVLDAELLFYGYLTGGLFVLRSGIEQQREGGLQTYLRHNLVTPLEHGLGAVLSLLGSWICFTALLFLVALACSAGDVGTAAWYGWTFGVGLAALLPFALMVESVATFRIPLILPVIGYVTVMIVLALTVGEERMAALIGLSADRADPATWPRLVGRAGVVVVGGMALYLAAVGVRGRRTAAVVEIVPSSH